VHAGVFPHALHILQGRPIVRKRINLGPILIAPGFIFIFMFLIFPIFFALGMSFFKTNFLEFVGFAGFENFIRILTHTETMNSIGRGIMMSLAAAITMFIGFWVAYWVDSRSGFFAVLLQLIGLVPWVLSMVVGALLWKWIFAGDLGLLNTLFRALGLPTVNPLGSRISAMISLIFVVSWRTIGYSMVMLLAGMKTVPRELEEAAMVDGASMFQRIIHITLPLIKTPLLVSGITVLMSNVNNVTVPMVLTGGGPVNSTNVVALELYRMGFVNNQYGMASALATIVIIINVVLIAGYLRVVKWKF
jgi:ABC-type sugar transport system permease subunit